MNTNTQKPEKKDWQEDGSLYLHSAFYTIQGEGPFAGRPAIFLRLAGCNLQCPQCDTDYTVNRRKVSVEESWDIVNDFNRPGSLVVITGGEPFRQNIRPAIEHLLDLGYRVQVETNGTLYSPLPYSEVTIVCSPKTGSINNMLLPHIAALKYVVSAEDTAEDDGLPNHALEHPAMPRLARPPLGFEGTVYVQPADHQNEAKNAKNLDACIRSSLRFGYTLCLQLHKIINME